MKTLGRDKRVLPVPCTTARRRRHGEAQIVMPRRRGAVATVKRRSSCHDGGAPSPR
ncbi:MAG: hypothetical protein PUJ80_11015 [Verrucomicrobiota bacterium]|nr:hypothetical protein [Verrucomicrobiota bacterium]